MSDPRFLPFFEHLDELRRRLLIALGATGLSAVAGYVFSEKALRFALRPLGEQVYFFQPQEAFVLRIKMALLLGVLIASPVILSQFWLFVSPALRVQERKAVAPLAGITSFLFLAGAAFCFFCVMPVAMKFLVGMQTNFLRPLISASEYISFLSTMLLAFGVAFNVPVFLVALVAAGVTTSRALAKARRQAIVLIFITAAVLTPGPDIASQLLLAIPLYLLYELSLVAARALEGRRAAAGGVSS